jgi:uncharacterized glyoxalase superfamily protein PhnB
VQAITPMLSYEDVAGAAEWLVRVFGCREDLRYESPKTHRERCEAAARWSETPFVVDGVHAYVEDVDAHFERARDSGARILSEIEDTPFGDRRYRVEDLKGHGMFAEQMG